MSYKEIFMLEVNQNRSKYLFLEKTDISQCVVICSKNHEVIFRKSFKNPVLTIKWVDRQILVQTKKNIILINPMNNEFKYFVNICDFIDKILYVSLDKYVICSTLSKLIVRINLIDIRHDLIGVYNEKLRFFVNLDSKIKKKIFRKITVSEKIYSRYKTRCKQYHDKFEIYLDNRLLLSDYGYIISRYAMQDEDIFLISSFIKPAYIFSPTLKSKKKFSINNKFIHKYIAGIPVYDNEIESDNIVIFLHGGPNGHYIPMHDLFVSKLNNYPIRIILLNYFGSTGYSNHYEKGLYNRGGTLDIMSIERVIGSLKGNLVLFGESYGAYLGILMSFKSKFKLLKIIAINGFVDIEFQRKYSVANKIIDNYFGIYNINNRNPIDFRKNMLKSELVLIHSINDKHCPIFQIDKFVNKFNSEKVKYYKIEGGHELYSYYEKKKILEIIKKEINI